MPGPVLVGMDGSEQSAMAARWALDAADRRRSPVVAIVAWSFLDQVHPDPHDGFDPHYREADADRALRSWLVAAVGSEGADRFERRAVCEFPATALVDAAAGASMLVLGARGAGGFGGLRLGSVADRVLQRTSVPTVIVPRPVEGARRVVVGIDRSAWSDGALRWAAEEAQLRGVPLEIVHAWQPSPLLRWAMLPDAPMFDRVRAASEASVREAAASVSATVADVIATSLEGHPASRLLEAAQDASVVVVGSRGLSNLAGAMLGSVTRQVVHHAASAAAVIPLRS